MEASLDWSSLVSAAIGGMTALLGVLITQRYERKKAHADRIWNERSTCYVLLFSWCAKWREYLMNGPGMGELLMKNPEMKPPEAPPGLSSDQWGKIMIYSSPDVTEATNRAHDLSIFARASLETRDGKHVRQTIEGLNAIVAVQHMIARETKTGGRAKVGSKPFVIVPADAPE